MEPKGRLAPQGWMSNSAARAIVAALTQDGAEVRFIGGCVRDAVAGRPVRDIDLATPDAPERVLDLLSRAGLKSVPTGLAHGTVTAVAEGRAFEVTTLRKDVETYGRRAKVAFTDDWLVDAERRDFTFNAMSSRPDGTLFDPFDGRDDLTAGRVRFIGDARQRIREDYLRLLRLFRFHAHFGCGDLHPAALAAATELAPHLVYLSRERIRNELLRLLEAPNPVAVLRVMTHRGILDRCLPEGRRLDRLMALMTIEPGKAATPDPLLRLGALLDGEAAVASAVSDRLRLSNRERARLEAMLSPDGEVTPEVEDRVLRRALYRRGAERVRDRLRIAWAEELTAEQPLEAARLDALLGVIAAWQPLRFPLQGKDAVKRGVPQGPAVGRLLERVEDWWITGDFQADRTACLAQLDRLVAQDGAGSEL